MANSATTEPVSLNISVSPCRILYRGFFSIKVTYRNNSDRPIYIQKHFLSEMHLKFYNIETGVEIHKRFFSTGDYLNPGNITSDEVVTLIPGGSYGEEIIGRADAESVSSGASYFLSFYSYNLPIVPNGFRMVFCYVIPEETKRCAKDKLGVELYGGELTTSNIVFTSDGRGNITVMPEK